MRPSALRLLAAAALLATAPCFVPATAAAPAADPALRDPARNSALKPEPRDANWVKRHEGFNTLAKQGGVDVLFVGDSITDGWRTAPPRGGKEIWDREYASLRAANFGIGGDRTQHVLWRLQNGNLDGIKPKAVVLMIGTNNTGFERDGTTRRNTPAETIEGVRAIVNLLRAKQPQAKILLLAVFPRGEKPDHPQRLQVAEINRGIAGLADGKAIRFLDLKRVFLAADGTLPKDVMPDFLHPHAAGYQLWADALRAPLAALLQ
jgi:lysophospholipase L1-like esterase